MLTRPLGPEGPDVAAIGFGGMPLSIELPGQQRPDESRAVEVLHRVLDAGATLLDTADVYCLDGEEIGHNERLIARALRTWPGPRDRVVVATKGGLTHPERHRWDVDARPEQLRAACDRSLAALGVDRIDLYQLHAPDRRVPFADSVGALAELRQAGKVRWVGLSNVSVRQIEAARRIVPVQSVQNMLNPFSRQALRSRFLRPSVVRHCARHGLAFLAYSPVGGGHLNRRLPDHPVLRGIAERHGVSAHAVVLAWVLAQGPTVIPIPGARTVEHAVDAIGAGAVRLDPDELAAIDAAEFPRP